MSANHDPHHHHHHGHGHDYDHDNHFSPVQARVKALETLMVAKGYVDP
ncbi:MAG: nitrile hydratase subunit alpha, partial [Bosea sp. (in: a-proteobacteria)]